MKGFVNNSQYGFRKGHSANQAAIELICKTNRTFENQEYVFCVWLDLCKAFDMIAHKTLLMKFVYYGVSSLASVVFPLAL